MTFEQPIETVFEYISDPMHLLAVWPGLTEITNLKTLPAGGYTFNYVYYIAGMRFEGFGQYVEYTPKTYFVCKLTGGIEGTLTFKFQPVGKQTNLFFTLAYTVPSALFAKLPEPAFKELSIHEVDCLLANLKTVLPFFVTAPVGR